MTLNTNENESRSDPRGDRLPERPAIALPLRREPAPEWGAAGGAGVRGLPRSVHEELEAAEAAAAREELPRRGLRRGKREPTSQGLVLGWCLWLLGAWAVTLWIEPALPSVRWMIFACVLGLMALWPALRLSQDYTAWSRHGPWRGRAAGAATPPPTGAALKPPALMLADWLALNLVFQVVLWPMRLSASWHVGQALWLDAGVAAWSLLTAAIVAVGCLSGRGVHRLLAMALCLLLVIGEPIVMALAQATPGEVSRPGWDMRVSPIQALWELSGPPTDWHPHRWAAPVVSVAAAAAMAWLIVLAAASRLRGRESAAAAEGHPVP